MCDMYLYLICKIFFHMMYDNLLLFLKTRSWESKKTSHNPLWKFVVASCQGGAQRATLAEHSAFVTGLSETSYKPSSHCIVLSHGKHYHDSGRLPIMIFGYYRIIGDFHEMIHSIIGVIST